MSLFDILACPTCRVQIQRENDELVCEACGRRYPIVDGVPVVFPDCSVPEIEHEDELLFRDDYNPWVHRVILQSLLDDQIVVEIGSGNMALDDPAIIRMDVKLTPHVDVVGDIHAMPFLPGSLDYVFSLAVFEHLRNPFMAAQSLYEVLKNGGYVYHECNFIFAYHGYPHHYFNATLQGMEQVFADFTHLRKGVAPYQMPAFALESVLVTYLKYSQAMQYPHGKQLIPCIHQLLANLREYDIYFTEDAAFNVAAGTYLSGFRQASSDSSLIPPVLENLWMNNPELRERFPNMNDLTTVNNVMAWAQGEGRERYPEIAAYLDGIVPFNKRGEDAPWNRDAIRSLPWVEPLFCTTGFDCRKSIAENAAIAEARIVSRAAPTVPVAPARGLVRRALTVLRKDGVRALLGNALLIVGHRFLFVGYRVIRHRSGLSWLAGAWHAICRPSRHR